MKSKAIRKLKQKSGETLAEVLVAVLVGSLSLALFAAMVGSSVKIIDESNDKLKEYYSETNNTAQCLSTPTTGKVKLSISTHILPTPDGETGTEYVDVNYYTNSVYSDTPVITFK